MGDVFRSFLCPEKATVWAPITQLAGGACTRDWLRRKRKRQQVTWPVQFLHSACHWLPQWPTGLDQLTSCKHRDGCRRLLSLILLQLPTTQPFPVLLQSPQDPKTVAPPIWLSSSWQPHGYYGMDSIQKLLMVYLPQTQYSLMLGSVKDSKWFPSLLMTRNPWRFTGGKKAPEGWKKGVHEPAASLWHTQFWGESRVTVMLWWGGNIGCAMSILWCVWEGWSKDLMAKFF